MLYLRVHFYIGQVRYVRSAWQTDQVIEAEAVLVHFVPCKRLHSLHRCTALSMRTLRIGQFVDTNSIDHKVFNMHP